MPEVDGIGWVDRDYTGLAPNGLAFSTMAGQTGGGKQVMGFLGVGINYFRSPKFIQADGGWNRTVWMPKDLKNKVLSDIPSSIADKVATQDDVDDLDKLKQFLIDKEHPVVEKWPSKEEEEKSKPTEAKADEVGQVAPGQVAPGQGVFAPTMPLDIPSMIGGGGEGIKVTLKNAKITIDKIIITNKK